MRNPTLLPFFHPEETTGVWETKEFSHAFDIPESSGMLPEGGNP